MAGERILVVDDGKEMRDFIVDYILKPNSFEPLVAENGLVGLEMIRRESPDLILLDLQMPKMNGMQVLDAMREHGIDIPVILMTLHGSEEIAVEVYRKGVRDYVKKPYTADEMLAAIERSLGEVRLRKEKDALTERLISANKDLNQHIRELNTLYHLGKSVTALMGIDDLLPRVVQAVTEVTGAETCSVYIIENQEIICRARKSVDDGQIRILRQNIQTPFAVRSVQQRQPLLLNPPEMVSHRQKNPDYPQAVMCCPMIIGERVIGAIEASFVSPQRTFRKQNMAMLTALTDYAAIAVENATNFNRVADNEAMTDWHELLLKFAPSTVVEQFMEAPTHFQVPSAYVEVAVLFASLRGYHPLVEHVASVQLIEFLNQYAELASQIVQEQGGMIERYLGDGFMAFFNVPEELNDYMQVAATTAIRLRDAVQALNVRLGVEGIDYTMALHSGVAVSGNMGVLRGINFSVLGETVELAKRLHGVAQAGQILLSEAIAQRLGNQIQTSYLGEMKLHGRTQPLRVYNLNDLA